MVPRGPGSDLRLELAPPMLSQLARSCRHASPSPRDGESGETCLCGFFGQSKHSIQTSQADLLRARPVILNEHHPHLTDFAIAIHAYNYVTSIYKISCGIFPRPQTVFILHTLTIDPDNLTQYKTLSPHSKGMIFP